jgi:hypothetical protein
MKIYLAYAVVGKKVRPIITTDHTQEQLSQSPASYKLLINN